MIDVFSAHRLLVLGQDGIEISHDALLQAWKQLRDWLGDDQLDRALYSQVVTDAATWESNRQDSSYLYRPGRLAAIDAATTRWQDAPTRYPPLPATSKAFLDAAHHAARRSTRRRRSAFAILALLTALAVVASVLASSQRAAAVRQRDQAIYNQVDRRSPPVRHQRHDASGAAHPGRVPHPAHRRPSLTPAEHREHSPALACWPPAPESSTRWRSAPTGARWPAAHLTARVRLWDVADPARPRPLGQPLNGGRSRGPPASSVSWRWRSAPTDTRWPAAASTPRSGCGTSPIPRAPGCSAIDLPAGRDRRRMPFAGVQPRRAHAGQRQRRRRGPAVGRCRSRAPAPAGPSP